MLEILEHDSPLSTKVLKQLSGLIGKANERRYERALKELWSRMRIVVFGEIDDGAFPSIAIGATRVLFEDLWQEARKQNISQADAWVREQLPPDSLFGKHYLKLKKAQAVNKKTTSTPSLKKERVIRFEDL